MGACLLLVVLAVPAVMGFAPSRIPQLLLRYYFVLAPNPTPYLLAGVLLGAAWYGRREPRATANVGR